MGGKEPKKVTAWISELGRAVHAANDEDWAEVHDPPKGKRPILYCPDSRAGCSNRLIAVQKTRKDGSCTRFFRFASSVPSDRRCDHASVDEPVVKRSSGGESDEHAWLKEYVVSVAVTAGYSGSVETTLEGGVRADVFVPNVPHGRVEVQRVATDIPSRTRSYPNTLWLLRQAFAGSSRNTRACFSEPCVQVRISSHNAKVNHQGLIQSKPIIAEPWLTKQDLKGLRVKATNTVLAPDDAANRGTFSGGSKTPQTDYHYFKTRPMELDQFLLEVWSGRRRWYKKGEAHHRFAGWALVADVELFHEWREIQRKINSFVAADQLAQPLEYPTESPVAPEAVDPASDLCSEPGSMTTHSVGNLEMMMCDSDKEPDARKLDKARFPPDERLSNVVPRSTVPMFEASRHQPERWWQRLFRRTN